MTSEEPRSLSPVEMMLMFLLTAEQDSRLALDGYMNYG